MRLSAALLAATLSAGLTVAAQAQNPEMNQNRLSASLSGAAEAPTPGSTDGTGTFNLTLKPDQGQICYTLRVSNVDSPTAAHIHKGDAGKSGPPVVTLKAPESGQVQDCATASKDVIEDIQENPDAYYVNVHNEKFPQGAVRGQLSEGTLGPMDGNMPMQQKQNNPMGNDTSAYGRDTTSTGVMGRDTTALPGSDTTSTRQMGHDSTSLPPR